MRSSPCCGTHGDRRRRGHPHPSGQEACRDRRSDRRGSAHLHRRQRRRSSTSSRTRRPMSGCWSGSAYRSPHAKSDLSSKFGVGPFEAAHLVERARGPRHPDRGLQLPRRQSARRPAAGSRMPTTETLAADGDLETRFGVRFDTLDIGGGFPVSYDTAVASARRGRRGAPAGAGAARRAPATSSPNQGASWWPRR